MDAIKAIYSRRSVRKYKPTPVSDEDLKEILEAGMMAPSAVNLQPWYFVAVRSEEQMRVLKEIMAPATDRLLPSLRARFAAHPEVVEETDRFIRRLGGAPACILVFQLKPDYEKTRESIVESVAAAIENLLIAATAKGIGSCWLTAALEVGADKEIRDLFAPGKGDLVAFVTLGYADMEPKAPARKSGRYIII